MRPVHPHRRDFLFQWCRATSAALVGSGVSGLTLPGAPLAAEDKGGFETKPGSDEFITEKHHDEIAAILTQWSVRLLDSPGNTEEIGKAIASDFLGTSTKKIE